MKKKYSPQEITTSVPRYVSNERQAYLKNQREIEEAEKRLKELEKKIKQNEQQGGLK